MSTLFPDTGAPARTGPRPEIVRALEGFGYKAEAVRKWTAVKANSVLHACRREEGIALSRAATKAATVDGPGRSRPSRVERAVAAIAIEQAIALSADETAQAVAYTVYCLTDDETARLAGYLVKLFRGSTE